jgi:hypothetical protein
MNRVPNKSTCSVVLGLVSGDLEPDDGSGDGLAGELVDLSEFADLTIDEGSDDGTIGDVGELGALPVIDGADFSMDATQGSIIIVSGRIGVVMEDGAVLVPVDPPAPDSMLGQIELMLSSMEQDPAELDNLDESETDSVGADEEDSGHGRDSVEGAPDGGTAPEAPAEDARIRRISRRGRGRQ